MDIRQAIENGLELYSELVGADPPLEQELVESRDEFFGGRAPEDDRTGDGAVALRRHLEWFVLERPSERLQGVPVEALADTWSERADPAARDALEALLGSRAGVFEVTGVEPGRGVWLRDLLGLGEYPIDEPYASHGLEQGDVVVGRLFPVGESLFQLSPAASCFRNEELLDALRVDLERLRGQRRGTLRISQAELERMFHRKPDEGARDAVGEARTLLLEAGVAEDVVGEIFATLRAAPNTPDNLTPGVGDALAHVLERLAFDSGVDLGAARAALLAAWIEMSSPATEAPEREARSAGGPERARKPGMDAAEALAEFDRARAEGGDLEELFDQLEHDLGLDAAGDESDLDPAPDFPGVVGAMVEEFLWDMTRERGEAGAEPLRCLRAFARFAEPIGVFENLCARDLSCFASCWLIEEGQLASHDDANAVLSALKEFCRWAEDRHQVELWSAFAEAHRRLCESLPRIARANGLLPENGAPHGSVWKLRACTGGDVDLEDTLSGERRAAHIEPELARWLRAGDLVRGTLNGDGRLAPYRCYPGDAAALLDREAG